MFANRIFLFIENICQRVWDKSTKMYAYFLQMIQKKKKKKAVMGREYQRTDKANEVKC